MENWYVAWTAIVDKEGFTLGLAERDVAGYSPLGQWSPRFQTYEEASTEARKRNEELGMTEREALEIVFSSMRAQNARV